MAVFVVIFAYGLLFGGSGALTPASPSPIAVGFARAPTPALTGVAGNEHSPSPSAAPSATPLRPSAGRTERLARAEPNLGRCADWLRRTRRAQSTPLERDRARATRLGRPDSSSTRGIDDAEVLRAMRAVPREQFVPADLAGAAYDDGALPIGHGQTISQPYIVASMTQALALPAWRAAHDGERPRVLDVGTGSGYQAAVLAELGADVVSIEREPDLAERPRASGWPSSATTSTWPSATAVPVLPDEAPFAGIVVAAAAPQVPVPLVEQLLPDGRLVLPIGGRDGADDHARPADARWIHAAMPVEPAVFVPLLGEHGFSDR